MPDLAILILAAGASTRMGQPKQLLPWKNTTLIGNTIAIAKKLTDSILVVLGANAEKVGKVIPEDVDQVVNSDWKSGMGASIALGTQVVEQKFNPQRLLVLLVDQPLIDVDYLTELTSFQNSNIVATAYGEKVGVPVVFSKQYFEELKNLNEDFGARYFLKKHMSVVKAMNANGRAADLDTPENYKKLFALYGN